MANILQRLYEPFVKKRYTNDDVPNGGKLGTVLVKTGDEDFNMKWELLGEQLKQEFGDTAEIVFNINDNGKVVAYLAQEVSNKLARALVTPTVKPTEEVLVSVDTTGAQALVKIGTGLKIENGELTLA